MSKPRLCTGSLRYCTQCILHKASQTPLLLIVLLNLKHIYTMIRMIQQQKNNNLIHSCTLIWEFHHIKVVVPVAPAAQVPEWQKLLYSQFWLLSKDLRNILIGLSSKNFDIVISSCGLDLALAKRINAQL